MRSMRLPSSLTYRNMAFSELRSAAESVLRDETEPEDKINADKIT